MHEGLSRCLHCVIVSMHVCGVGMSLVCVCDV